MDAEDDDGRRQRLATGIAIGMSIGVALSLALGSWSMLAVGVALSIVFAAGAGGDAGSSG